MELTRRRILFAIPALTACAAGAHAQGGSLPWRYQYATGIFERVGATAWLERTQTHTFHFSQQGITGGYIYLVDYSRVLNGDPNRPMYLRLPVGGGMAQWSFPNPFQWQDLYVVRAD